MLYIDQHQGLLVPLWLWSKSASYGQIVIPQKTVVSTLKGTQSQAASAVPPPKHRPTASELQIVLCFSHSFHVSLFLDLWHPAEDLDLVLDTEEPGSGSWHWGTCFQSLDRLFSRHSSKPYPDTVPVMWLHKPRSGINQIIAILGQNLKMTRNSNRKYVNPKWLNSI